MAAGQAQVPPPPTNAPAQVAPPLPPPPPGYAYAYPYAAAPVAPPAPAEKGAGAVGLAIFGGILGLVGAFIGWLQVSGCVGTMGFSMCVSVPVPPSMAITNYDAFAGLAPTLAMVFGLAGIVLVVLKKPPMALVGGLMGVLTIVFAGLWLARASPFFAQMAAGFGGSYATVNVGPGIGLYVSIVGGAMLALGGLLQWKALKADAAKPATPAAPAPTA